MTRDLYFSRIRLKRDSAEVVPLIHDLLPDDEGAAMNIAHRMLWTLMPQALRDAQSRAAGDSAAFLWREGEQRGVFYLLGPRPLPGNAYFTVDTKPYTPAFQPGDRLEFDLTVNATVDRKVGAATETRRKSQRCDIVIDAIRSAETQTKLAEGQLSRRELRFPLAETTLAAWLAAQGAAHGFRLETCDLRGYRTVALRRGGSSRRQTADLGVGSLRGMLEVIDPGLFTRKITIGFGRAKAFGCGLMLLKRLRPHVQDDDDDGA